MVSRFGVLEQQFYDVFDRVDECAVAAFDEGVARVSGILVNAAAPQERWLDRVRAGLRALLEFFDEEPHWARFLILETPIAAVAIAQRRTRALRALAHALEIATPLGTSRSASFAPASELTAQLIVGGVFSVVRARILDGSSEPLGDLVPSLMSFILAYQTPEGRLRLGPTWAGRDDQRGVGREGLPVRATYRTTRVLRAIGASPHLSNREIADAAGLSDEGQTSKLLRRLEQRGLVENVGLGQVYGGANAWLLTAYGQRVLDATRHSLVPGAGAVSAGRARGAA